VNKLHDDQALSDLDATYAWVGKNGGKLDHLAITGFCRGGRMTWMYAAHNPKVKAAVAWYGPLDGKKTDAFPTNPIDVVDQIKVPVLGLYGGLDKSIPQDQVEAMKAKAAKDGVKAEFVVYPNAEHGFNADYRPSYNPEAATDGWKRMLAWFKANGVA
jgi:carboxymethylenebutenolidase